MLHHGVDLLAVTGGPGVKEHPDVMLRFIPLQEGQQSRQEVGLDGDSRAVEPVVLDIGNWIAIGRGGIAVVLVIIQDPASLFAVNREQARDQKVDRALEDLADPTPIASPHV